MGSIAVRKVYPLIESRHHPHLRQNGHTRVYPKGFANYDISISEKFPAVKGQYQIAAPAYKRALLAVAYSSLLENKCSQYEKIETFLR